MENNNWMIVRKEKLSTKIKNYFKNIFSKMLNQNKKKKKNKGIWPKREEPVQVVNQEPIREMPRERVHKVEKEMPKVQNKQITIEVTPTKRKPKEIVIEYENKKKPKSKQIVVEYANKKKQNQAPQIKSEKQQPTKQIYETKIERQQSKQQVKERKIEQQSIKQNRERKIEKQQPIKQVKENKVQKQSVPIQEVKAEPVKKSKIKLETKEIKLEQPELALKPVKVKPKKEKKPFNIFQLFKDKERKKRKEILNRIRENKVDDYETISTKTKLSKGSIVVDDVDANELDPLIDLYRDSNKKLRNRIRESQIQ